MMLVVSRTEGQEIVCSGPSGAQVVIRVASIKSDRVRLVVQTSKEWTVLRRELYDELQVTKNDGRLQVDVYIADADPAHESATLIAIQDCVANLLHEFGFDADARSSRSHVGSWTWSAWYRRNRVPLTEEATSLYQEVKEGARRFGLDSPGAEAFSKRANATAALLASLDPYEEVIIRLGDVIIAKSRREGRLCLVVETMSPAISRALQDDPQLLRDPARFISRFGDPQLPDVDQ